MDSFLKTPLTLITGFLGSGKTTFLRKILDDPPAEFAVLMNEFGELAIDSQVIRGKNIEMIELAGGCVCCSLAGELKAAVRELLEKVHPEWILLEATGVAEADALVFEVEDNIPEVRLDSVIYIVDAYASQKFPEIGYAMRSQLEAADIILLNKRDLVESDAVENIRGRLKKFNNTARILETTRCDIDVGMLFGLHLERRPRSAVSKKKGAAHSGFEAFSFVSLKPLNRQRLEQVMEALPSEIFRAKGLIQCSQGGFLFNAAAGRRDWEEFPAEKTELVFIGPRIRPFQDEIIQKLKECET